MKTIIRVQMEAFSVGDEYERLTHDPDCGAVVTFTGLVRDLPHAAIQALELEHYPEMTERMLQGIADQARQRWSVRGITIIHRIGRLSRNQPIVFVGVASAHRHSAFHAAEFIMDFLKTRAPFWKKEETSDTCYWVAAKASDQRAAKRWEQDSAQ